MPIVTALDARTRFGRLIEMAQRSPVTITRNGHPSVVVMSAADYERRRMNAGKRLLAAMNRVAEEAVESGLTEQDWEELLSNSSLDES